MAITVVQSTFAGTFSGSTVACAFTSNVTTGNTIVAVFSAAITSALSVSSIAVSPGSGSFNVIVAQAGTSIGVQLEGWAAGNVTGGTTPTVTVTMSRALASGNTEAAAVAIYEISGMPSAITTDGTAIGNTGTSTSGGLCTTSAITTTNANDILFSAFVPDSHMSAGESGWTFQGDSGNYSGFGAQYLIVSSTQSGLQATGTCASGPQPFAGIVFALQAAGATTVNPTISGSMLVTGTPVVTLAYSWTVPGNPLLTGSVNPTLSSGTTLNVTISGSTATVTGALQPSLAVPISGSAIVSGALQPSLSLTTAGTALVSGSVSPTLQQTQLMISITGAIGVHGSVSLPQFGGPSSPGEPWYITLMGFGGVQ